MKHMTAKEYGRFVKERSPASSVVIKCFRAFLCGGLICAAAQVISKLFAGFGYDKETVSSLTSVAMIFTGALLTAFDIYDRLALFAGAGTVVPITGFANSIVSPAMEFRSEGLVLGTAAKMFVIAGPVLVYGISASVICGFFLWIFGGAA